MNQRAQAWPQHRLRGLGVLLLVPVLPLLGSWIAGREIRPIFRFPPPLNVPIDYPSFSAIGCALVLLALGSVLVPWFHARAAAPRHPAFQPSTFPPWGWGALGWMCGWWVLTWTRFEWFAPLQPYTFFPLWLGLIVSANAVAAARTGTCLLTRAPRTWLSLFAISAIFWWGFEWLNRFVQNWHYLGTSRFGAAGYAFHATLCFSTVLPAVAAVAECIASVPPIANRLAAGPRWRALAWRPAGIGLIAAACLALVATGIWPRQSYPALWAAPLGLLLADGMLRHRGGTAAEIAQGDWRSAGAWILGALVCGFFWEMWNWRSDPKWIYTVPYVDRWHVFEMPVLGYIGYLPFGLECLLVVERSAGPRVTRYPAALPDRFDRAM